MKETIRVAGVEFKRPVAAKRDFTELIGKEFMMKQVDDKNLKCIVEEIDYDIGISIRFERVHGQYSTGPRDNGVQYAICLNGPAAKYFGSVDRPRRYNARFFSIVRGIKVGQFDVDKVVRIADSWEGGPMAPCAFS